MTAAEALAAGARHLAAADVPDPARDARRLLAHAMDLAPGRLTLHLPDRLTDAATDRFEAAIAARRRRQPVAQITGCRDFFGRSFRVTRDVLDPRPETETLIAAALAAPARRVLDLGTGTGCILLTLLSEWPEATGLGSDVSEPALAVARRNAVDLGVAGRARFARADWGRGIDGSFDLIVSNPPYIAAEDMPGLAPEVRDWEPHAALTPGGDGLGAFRRILGGVGSLTAPGARVLMEIGPGQAAAVAGLCRAVGLGSLDILADLDGRDRVISARRDG